MIKWFYGYFFTLLGEEFDNDGYYYSSEDAREERMEEHALREYAVKYKDMFLGKPLSYSYIERREIIPYVMFGRKDGTWYQSASIIPDWKED